jgi:hypothetical protein
MATGRPQAVTRAPAGAAAEAVAMAALRALRRATLGRSLRANLRWAVRAVGWGSLVYLAFWSLILVIAALQALAPLPAPLATTVARWAAPAGAGLLAMLLVGASRTRVTPVWLDRRDLTHLVYGALPARALLGWPAWRAAIPGLVTGTALGGLLALVLPRLLGVQAPAAVVLLPALAATLLVLRWRSAMLEARDALGRGLALLALLAAAVAGGCASAGIHACALGFAAPAAAALGLLTPTHAMLLALFILIAAVALAVHTRNATAVGLPPLVLRQSEFLAELRAIATLRGLAALSVVPPDPGARFAAARARAALLGLSSAAGPGWRPALPNRGGAIGAFAWLGLVRGWRSSPWGLAALLPVAVGVSLATPVTGPFGGAALLPSVALAWVASQVHPGRAGWPGFAIDARARLQASLLLVSATVVGAAFVAAPIRSVLGWQPAVEGWLTWPLALAAASLVDAIGARAADPRGPDVWLLAGLLVASPAALLGWFGVAPGVAAPLAAAAWALAAWLRVLAVARHA